FPTTASFDAYYKGQAVYQLKSDWTSARGTVFHNGAIIAFDLKTAPAAPVDDPSIHYLTSPIVGTFYRASNPNSPAFVSPGDRVKPGQTLCIVEAMKLMNEIECDVAGEVVKVLVENGQPVEYGERLFAIKVG
ncbi:MAG TPA: acetyl-CoA carboxylase biotin carboxyl carrier protein, partial [Holophagaceae bacterium]|nr:acetyl-CoA carboxylase biotin carboxyl carrier protein [Holophagaceae bacterium]